MHPDLTSISRIHAALTSRRATAAQIIDASLAAIHAANPRLNAFIQIFDAEARAAAADLDRRLVHGEKPGPLAAVPVALKDNIATTTGRTTCASRFLEHYRSPYDAAVVERLTAAGAIIVGKTNLDEFAMGSSTEHSAFGPTRNPWDESRVPGGSSGGSAAAVAAGLVPVALGSDTGGSVRQPAALCGVVGLKPTYGRVSRWGLTAFASSLDQIGVLARTPADSAAVLSVIAGHDDRDSTSASIVPTDYTTDLDKPVHALTIGVPRQARSPVNSPAAAMALEAAINTLTDLGAKIVEIDLPHAEHAVAAYYIIAPAEASSNLARFDGVRFGRRAALGPTDDLEAMYRRSRAQGFGPEVQRRIMLGTHVLSSGYYDAYYATALRVRRLIKQDFDHAFAEHHGKNPACHAVLMPVTTAAAFKIGSKAADPLAMYLEDIYTVSANLAGLPAVAFPAGVDRIVEDARERTLPIGLQLIGPVLSESVLLRIVRMFEAAKGSGGWGGLIAPGFV